MNSKQKQSRTRKIQERKLKLRNKLWPGVDDELLWSRTHDGYTTMPRAIPQIIQIIDELAPKGKPVALTYLSLWCRVFDESMINIQNERELAYESGFTGQRAVTTWHGRMKILKSLEFIDIKSGAAGNYQYVLILNPYLVINKLRKKKKISDPYFFPLFSRAQDIGADDELE